MRSSRCSICDLQYLRPAVRALLLKIACGEGIPPDFVRIVLAGCLKGASLRAVVKTIPTKERRVCVNRHHMLFAKLFCGSIAIEGKRRALVTNSLLL